MPVIGWRHERFAALIEENKTTLEELSAADGIGKSKETLRRYADARSDQTPSFDVGMSIARFFDVHPHWLAGLRETRGRFPDVEVTESKAAAR